MSRLDVQPTQPPIHPSTQPPQDAEVKQQLEAALARGFAEFEASMPRRVEVLGGSDAALGALLAHQARDEDPAP